MSRRIRVNPAIIINFAKADSTIAVGDLVAFSTSTENAVIKADATDNTKMPVIGLARRVTTNNVAVQMDHQYTFASNHGFSTGQELYAHPSQAGKLTNVRPTNSDFSAGSGFIQKIGYATNNTAGILIKIDQAGQDLSLPEAGAGSEIVVQIAADETLAIGDIVRIAEGSGDGNTAGRVKKSVNSDNKSSVVGVSKSAVNQGTNGQIQVQGIATISFNPSLSNSDVGKTCYLSNVSGRATVSIPTSGSVIELGRVLTQDSSTGTVLLQIQTILHAL